MFDIEICRNRCNEMMSVFESENDHILSVKDFFFIKVDIFDNSARIFRGVIRSSHGRQGTGSLVDTGDTRAQSTSSFKLGLACYPKDMSDTETSWSHHTSSFVDGSNPAIDNFFEAHDQRPSDSNY